MPVSDPLRSRLQVTLDASYTLERELGGGGMSRVFLATERLLQRHVVVKVLAPELAEGLSAERFAREIQVAATLQDPHIVPLLTAGESGGIPWFTMPFVDGESLRARLERGAVPLGEALGILRDIALALEYAHAHGVVHRDIKPANVLLAGRTAVVADFGIAKAVSVARTQTSDAEGVGPDGTLTQIGISLGTPAYMAPEQVTGDPADHRADLYAWGLVAYELLAGRHPFAGNVTATQFMRAQLLEMPHPLAAACSGVSPPVAAIVMQCLAKDASQRPRDAAELLRALDGISVPGRDQAGAVATRAARWRMRSIVLVATLVIAMLVGGGLWRGRHAVPPAARTSAGGAGPAEADAGSIAVLPFENLGDSADAYLADGITDAVRGKLTVLPGMVVIARASSVGYRGTAKSPAVIARELGVRYLLTGTVRFAGTEGTRRVQVSPELVEVGRTERAESRWQQPFDAEIRDVFGVQSDIAGRVASAMRVALGDAAEARLVQAPTRDPAAYDALLRAEATINGGVNNDPASLRRAIAYYEQALARDASISDAWAGLAQASASLYANTTPTARVADAALAGARRALALDPAGVAGRRALGQYYRLVQHDPARALAEFESAREVAPRDARVLTELANVEGDLFRLEESRQDLAAALRLDPRSARLWGLQARTLLRLRRPTDARAAAARALALAPTSLNAIGQRVLVEAAAGDLGAAREVVAQAKRDVPAERVVAYLATYWDLGWVLDPADEQLLLTLGTDAFDGQRSGWAVVRAEQYGWLGDSARARAWGDSARRALADELAAAPRDAQRRVFHGLALAYAARGREGIAEAGRGLALAGRNAAAKQSLEYAYYTYVGARTALLAGDRARALAGLAEAVRLHYFVTPAWLRADPTWAPLRDDPGLAPLLAER